VLGRAVVPEGEPGLPRISAADNRFTPAGNPGAAGPASTATVGLSRPALTGASGQGIVALLQASCLTVAISAWYEREGDRVVAADAVYRFLGVEGLGVKRMPPLHELVCGSLGYFIRKGKHSMTAEDWGHFWILRIGSGGSQRNPNDERRMIRTLPYVCVKTDRQVHLERYG